MKVIDKRNHARQSFSQNLLSLHDVPPGPQQWSSHFREIGFAYSRIRGLVRTQRQCPNYYGLILID